MTDTWIQQRTIAGQPRLKFEACRSALQATVAEIACAHEYEVTPAMLHRWGTAIGEAAVMLETVLKEDTWAALNLDSEGAHDGR